MNEKPPKNPNLKIEHFSDEYKGESNEDVSAPMDVISGLLSEQISFSDEELQKKFEELKKAHNEAKTLEEKTHIEFLIRQLRLS